MRIIQFYWCIYYYYFRTPYRCLNYTPDTLLDYLYRESHFLLLLCEQAADRIYSFRKIKTLLSRVAHRGFKLTFLAKKCGQVNQFSSQLHFQAHALQYEPSGKTRFLFFSSLNMTSVANSATCQLYSCSSSCLEELILFFFFPL